MLRCKSGLHSQVCAEGILAQYTNGLGGAIGRKPKNP